MTHQLGDPQHKRPLAAGVTSAILVPVGIAVVSILLKADQYAYAFALGFLIYGLFVAAMLVLLLRRSGHLSGIYVLVVSLVIGAAVT
jgi:hypothetical protein